MNFTLKGLIMNKAFLFFILLTCSLSLLASEAKLVVAQGEIKLNDKITPTPDLKNIDLQAGTVIEAIGKKSFFIVEYNDKSRFMIREGKIIIKKLEANNSFLHLLQGTLFSYVNPKAAHKFKVKTKRGSFGVRGTKFWLQETNEESYLCVCEGVVAVRNNHSLMLINPGEDLHLYSPLETLQKNNANDNMWSMAVDGFKTMGLEVAARK